MHTHPMGAFGTRMAMWLVPTSQEPLGRAARAVWGHTVQIIMKRNGK